MPWTKGFTSVSLLPFYKKLSRSTYDVSHDWLWRHTDIIFV